jgi:hypothetical protein
MTLMLWLSVAAGFCLLGSDNLPTRAGSDRVPEFGANGEMRRDGMERAELCESEMRGKQAAAAPGQPSGSERKKRAGRPGWLAGAMYFPSHHDLPSYMHTPLERPDRQVWCLSITPNFSCRRISYYTHVDPQFC